MSVTGRDASFGEAALPRRPTTPSTISTPPVASSAGPPTLVVEDNSRYLPGESATAAKKLHRPRQGRRPRRGECASSRTLEAAPVAQAAGVPLVTPASTNPA